MSKFFSVLFLTLILQLIADHIMRTSMDGAPIWFPYAVAAAMGLVALMIIYIVRRKK